jgi:hypothetical protein
LRAIEGGADLPAEFKETGEARLLSEPVEILLRRSLEAIQSKPEKAINLTDDRQFGFITHVTQREIVR